ncbi:hypothetical protein AKJ51_00385 [candidate division MSBL1 archaeon SCGC-AAA382A20]|uniref:Metallo-beta-lactamase domain-containing protein n=1 Tax=candidate division MSBL1 archaeon SCGC-AAA382A20 TaxID=1698280 RepID=A0A133VMN1_9EURY|nr:hypothetical protein AKJ51_00385 [candidate division MSBL1 archaeon SCGC-AAA382A20]
MTSLTFYGGVREIGGNKTLFEEGDTKVFLDFGKSFGGEKTYYEQPFLSPRNEEQLLDLGLLPDVDGIYKDDEPPSVDGVLITHPHLDHWGYTCFLDDDIPLYCGECTKDMILSYEYCSSAGPRKEFYLANFTKSSGREVYKKFETFRTGDRCGIGSLEIEPVHVDHSIPAAYGYIIHTSSKTIAYTGDFRFHGPKSEMTRDFVEAASKADVDVLLIEGTNITGATVSSEQQVKRTVSDLIGEAEGLVVASFSDRDVDRLRSIYQAAQENDRKLVMSMKQAFLIQTLREDPKIDVPDIRNQDVMVFSREKSSTSAWEEVVHEEVEVHSGADINPIQEDVVLVASYYDMNDLLDVEPRSGSIFILSQSEFHDESGEIQHEKLLNWCDHYGMPQYQAHASGHAMPHELKSVIREINPETVIPIHTERPSLYESYISDLDIEFVSPELNEKVSI